MRVSVLLSMLLFVSSAAVLNAAAQSLSTSVGSVLDDGTGLCQNNGTTHAACTGHWSGSDGDEEASGGGTANANYGDLTSDARAVVNCSDACILGAQTVSGSDFTDTANIQNAPTSGSFFLVRISLGGSVSNASTSSPELQLNINGDSAQCAILTDKGSCHARLPLSGPTDSFDFSVGLVSSVTASLDGAGPGTDTEYADLKGTVVELAVVNGKGEVLKNVVITTASGHQYPQ